MFSAITVSRSLLRLAVAIPGMTESRLIGAGTFRAKVRT